MKVGVIGAGTVGSSCVYSLIMRNCAQEIVLIDINKSKAIGIITDMQYGACISSSVKLSAGDYNDLYDASVILITAGVNEKTGGATDRNDPSGRLKLLQANAKIYHDIIPQIESVVKDAIIVVVTDPPDPLADITRKLAGYNKVLSTGTYLDSLRFAFHLSKVFQVAPQSLQAQVIGEHGTSEVFVWSQAQIANKNVIDMLKDIKIASENFQQKIEDEVRFANITIIEGNDASQYGIGMVSARIAEIILHDENIIIPVGSYQPQYGVTLSLPSVLGREGVTHVFEPHLSKNEKQAFEKCVETLNSIAKSI